MPWLLQRVKFFLVSPFLGALTLLLFACAVLQEPSGIGAFRHRRAAFPSLMPIRAQVAPTSPPQPLLALQLSSSCNPAAHLAAIAPPESDYSSLSSHAGAHCDKYHSLEGTWISCGQSSQEGEAYRAGS